MEEGCSPSSPVLMETKFLNFVGFMLNPLSWVMEAAAILAIALANGGKGYYQEGSHVYSQPNVGGKEMGLTNGQTNGSRNEDGFSKFFMGGKGKYQKMGAELRDEEESYIIKKESMGINNNKYVSACAIFASLNSVLLGYDVGVMGGAIIFIQEDLKITKVQEVLVGCLSIESLLGSLVGGRTSDAIGRKKWIILADEADIFPKNYVR